ncbi:MAG: hypothetical protein MRY77_00285 [Rhodobacteraceae bacterium]|nr:hypothetical protein [Paracoccaceae bacterium]
MRSLFVLFFCFCFLSEARAQVAPVPYSYLKQILDGRVTFESLPQRREPGFKLDSPIRAPGLRIGERFAGQRLTHTNTPWDQVDGQPRPPLRLLAGRNGRNLSVAWHRGFGSNALFPLGHIGFPAIEARGEGAIAVQFDVPQSRFGLRIHSDYPAPLGQRAPGGSAIFHLYDFRGTLIAQHEFPLHSGILEIGLQRPGGISDISGFVLTNTDPGGIAIDDILFQLTSLTG